MLVNDYGISFNAAVPNRSSDQLFDLNHYLNQKVNQLNASGHQGKTWDVNSTLQEFNKHGLSPYEHYSQHGWREGLNPSQNFNTNHYLSSKTNQLNNIQHQGNSNWNPQGTADAFRSHDLDPLEHYQGWGMREGVSPLPQSNVGPGVGPGVGPTGPGVGPTGAGVGPGVGPTGGATGNPAGSPPVNQQPDWMADFLEGLKASQEAEQERIKAEQAAREAEMARIREAEQQREAERQEAERQRRMMEVQQLQGTMLSGQQSRVDSFRNLYSGELSGLDRLFSGLDPRDGVGLTSAENAMNRIQSGIQGFNLPQLSYMDHEGNQQTLANPHYDFGDLLGQVGNYQGRLQDISSQRQSMIGDLSSQLASKQDALSGLNPWDEAGINELMSQAREARTNALGFGDRGLSDSANQLVEGINSSLDGLYSQRGDLEQQAQELLASARDQSFYNMDDIDNFDFGGLLGDIDQWGATQAQDEIGSIENLLLRERQRIEQEQQAIAASRQASTAAMMQQLNGPANAGQRRWSGNGLWNWDDDTAGLSYDDSALARALGLV